MRSRGDSASSRPVVFPPTQGRRRTKATLRRSQHHASTDPASVKRRLVSDSGQLVATGMTPVRRAWHRGKSTRPENWTLEHLQHPCSCTEIMRRRNHRIKYRFASLTVLGSSSSSRFMLASAFTASSVGVRVPSAPGSFFSWLQ